MKRAIAISLLSLLFIAGPGVLTSCSVTHESKLTSSVTTRSVDVSGRISKLESCVPVPIKYREGKPSMKIIGPADVIEHIKVKQKGVTLELTTDHTDRYKGKYDRDYNYKGVRIELTLPNLNSISLNGAGDLTASKIVTTSLDLKMNGAGDVDIEDVDANVVKITCGGAGDVTIGKVISPQLQIFSQGAGDIDIKKVSATSVNATIQGAGDLEAKYVEASLIDLIVQGAGSVDLPNIDVATLRATVQGAGSLTVGGTAGNARLLNQGAGSINARGLDAGRVTTTQQGVGKIHCK